MSPDRPGQTLRRRIPSAKVPSTRFNLTNKMMVPGQEGGESENSPVASRALEGAPVTQEEADAILMQLTERDDNRQKTWSRMLVERYFLNVRQNCNSLFSCNRSSTHSFTFCHSTNGTFLGGRRKKDRP